MFKKLLGFIRSKTSTFVAKNISVEDQYVDAANKIIDKIEQLRIRHATANKDIININTTANEKLKQAESKEKEIRYILKQNKDADVVTHAKLGILYRRTSEALKLKAEELKQMQTEIEKTVVSLNEQRKDIAVKLEFIRECNTANSMGINSVQDVIESAEFTKIDVETILTKIDTFNGESSVTNTTSADVAEYIESLK